MKMTDIRKMTISTVVSIDGKTNELDSKVFVYNKNVITDEDVIALYHSGTSNDKVLTLTKEQASNLFYEEPAEKTDTPTEPKKRVRRAKAEMSAAATKDAEPVVAGDKPKADTEPETVETEPEASEPKDEPVVEDEVIPMKKMGRVPEFSPVNKYKGMSADEITTLLKNKNR